MMVYGWQTGYHRPAIEVYRFCPRCGGAHRLRYRRTIFGRIKVRRSCCGEKLGKVKFPPLPRHMSKRRYIEWLNG